MATFLNAPQNCYAGHFLRQGALSGVLAYSRTHILSDRISARLGLTVMAEQRIEQALDVAVLGEPHPILAGYIGWCSWLAMAAVALHRAAYAASGELLEHALPLHAVLLLGGLDGAPNCLLLPILGLQLLLQVEVELPLALDALLLHVADDALVHCLWNADAAVSG